MFPKHQNENVWKLTALLTAWGAATYAILVSSSLVGTPATPNRATVTVRAVFQPAGCSSRKGGVISMLQQRSPSPQNAFRMGHMMQLWGKSTQPQQSFALRANLPDRADPSPIITPQQQEQQPQIQCDVLVLGSGPAARSIAALLSATPKNSNNDSNNNNSLKVVLADRNADRAWPPNYGVWQDEWQTIVDRYEAAGVSIYGGNVGNSIDRHWNVTDCYFGGSFAIPVKERMRLNRPYRRVDRHALRTSLTLNKGNVAGDGGGGAYYTILKANHFSRSININMYSPPGSIVHDEAGTFLQLQQADGSLVVVRCKLVVDCTGHETKLVPRETREPHAPPGYQIAYGVLVDVDESTVPDRNQVGPYDKDAMTLFDYRTDHFDSVDPETIKKVESAPTFMYAMPLEGNKIFFEETSLVARPALSFQECKDRCFLRLEYHGIKVTKVYEEEYCYIPMGGALPAKDVRIIGVGGAAAMVHPSTGFHLCRAMMGAYDVAQVIRNELSMPDSQQNLDRAAALAYHALWSPSNIRQRNFAVFGGDYLMKQNVVGLRGFFDGFFRLPLEMWAGFLAGWPGLPNNDRHETWYARMVYGLTFVSKLPVPVAVDMLLSIFTYTIREGVPLMQSVTPFFGQPPSYEYERNTHSIGDVAAKTEARRMIQESTVEDVIPVDFEPAEASLSFMSKPSSMLASEQVSAASGVDVTGSTNKIAVVDSFQ